MKELFYIRRLSKTGTYYIGFVPEHFLILGSSSLDSLGRIFKEKLVEYKTEKRFREVYARVVNNLSASVVGVERESSWHTYEWLPDNKFTQEKELISKWIEEVQVEIQEYNRAKVFRPKNKLSSPLVKKVKKPIPSLRPIST